MEDQNIVIDFLTNQEFEERAKSMIEHIKAEATTLQRPIYFGDGKYCYEQWSNGKKYLLITERVREDKL